MSLKTPACAGVEQSGDIVVALSPSQPGDGLCITLTSPVAAQFGQAVETVIRRTLAEHGVADAVVEAKDQGALDFVVRARVKAALFRAGIPPQSGEDRS